MKRSRLLHLLVPIFVLLLSLTLSLLVVFLMRHVQHMLNSDVRINLTEVVTQNKDAITSRLMMSVNSLDVFSNEILTKLRLENAHENESIYALLDEYSHEHNTETLFLANLKGLAPLPAGKQVDISGRNYFRLALANRPNISEKLVSRIDGNEVFVISVPLVYEDKVIGTVQRVYTLDEMYALCSLSLFSAQGYMYVINKDGYIVIHPPHQNCVAVTDNYFRDLYLLGNPETSNQIKEDIANNKSGFMEITNNNREFFAAYTPVDKIHDWYLITSVPKEAVSPNAKTTVKTLYILLFVLVGLFSLIAGYFLHYKNKQRQQIEKIAFVDPVTGGNTYNRFLVHAQNVLKKRPDSKFFIAKFDIDNFKYINNFYGFAFGDDILRKIEKGIERQLGPQEMIARVYGDVFALLLENASEKRIDALFASVENSEVSLHFSVGVCAVTHTSRSVNLMLDKAGMAAQTVKGKLDKKIGYYSDEFEQKTYQNEQTKRAVKQALKNHEFQPFYQPKVNILNKKLVGCEALARWKTADGKFVFPSEFIPLCEETGLIVDVDMQIYESVLRFLRHCLDNGIACLPISVNFSRLHLSRNDFINELIEKQKKYEVPSNLIELELTESAMFDNFSAIKNFVQTVHAHGFTIALDDFGSGYSSLNMLKDIPIDILKIDKGFLDETENNKRRDTIFVSIVEMVHRLRIKVVVEGVENEANVELMKKSGCIIAQGYYYAKPMDEKNFLELLIKGRIE